MRSTYKKPEYTEEKSIEFTASAIWFIAVAVIIVLGTPGELWFFDPNNGQFNPELLKELASVIVQ